MIRAYIALCLALAVSSFPQSGSNLCGSDERGVLRVAGDTWQQDCNRCRCTDNLLPGCTKRFCPLPPGSAATTTNNTEQRTTVTNLCGSDERGVARVAGDTWQEDCNRCKCTDKLVPGCTKRFCGAPGASTTTSRPTSSVPRVGGGGGGVMFPGHSRGDPVTVTTVSCTDKSGNRREVGESWSDGCNTCSCGNRGFAPCTERFCINVEEDPVTVTTVSCTDNSGNRREVGESWAEDCNTCSCGNRGVALCTHRFCINVEEFKKEKFLFTVDPTKDVEEIAQCSSEGAKNCRAVKLHPEYLSSTSSADSQFLKLVPGSEVEMEVVRGPADLTSDTLSYVFRLSDGGEATLTVRQSTSAAYGSFKPLAGSVHYNVEACQGEGCNVLYERDSNFFNNFED